MSSIRCVISVLAATSLLRPAATLRITSRALCHSHGTQRSATSGVRTSLFCNQKRCMGNMSSKDTPADSNVYHQQPKPEITFTEEELREKLTAEEYRVTQQKGTERAWAGKYVEVKDDGTFHCVVCGVELFKTDKKFESGSGWPSFSDVADKGNVARIVDTSFGMTRTEVVCAKCGAHLGHVFDDGPKEDTGLRYCINSASLKLKKADQ